MEQDGNHTAEMAACQIATIWWPDGWEPTGPLDVPNCLLPAKAPAAGPTLDYRQAEAMVQALNRQCIDSPGTTWYVILAAAHPAAEPSSKQTQASVTEFARRVVRPRRGTAGDCTCCPAHGLPCAKGE
ncbi:MAG: hypothetical protein U1E05_11495 [Patescibacteria group bacterium]|nr:hypothetical protein [Patescibacteria group bacterium]